MAQDREATESRATAIHDRGEEVAIGVGAASPTAGAVVQAGLRLVDRMTGYKPPPPAPVKAPVYPYATKVETDMGQHVSDGMTHLNAPEVLHPAADPGEFYFKGVQYTYNYRAWLDGNSALAKMTVDAVLKQVASDADWQKLPEAERRTQAADAIKGAQQMIAALPIKVWKDDYYQGYADPAYFEHYAFMSWKLKKGKSASAAVKSWLAGLTLAECNTTMCVLEYDALRAQMGDAAFDHAFGTTGQNGLDISPNSTQTNQFLIATDAANAGAKGLGVAGNRPAKIGEWYYFCNHPKYLLKHPGGAWQGENALLASVQNGVQYWSGLGAGNMTEDAMLDEMVEAYNGPRDDDDKRALAQYNGKLPDELDPAKKQYPDQVTKKDILTAPPFTWLGQERHGGFLSSVGMRIDPAAIKRLSDAK